MILLSKDKPIDLTIDMPGEITCEIRLYADYNCLVFQANDLDTISEKLNTEFNKLCDWFVDNKLSIPFGDDKTKSILFLVKTVPGMISSRSPEVRQR